MFCFAFIIYNSKKHLVLKSFNNFSKADSEKNAELHDRDTKYYIENTCHQFPDFYMSSNSH